MSLVWICRNKRLTRASRHVPRDFIPRARAVRVLSVFMYLRIVHERKSEEKKPRDKKNK